MVGGTLNSTQGKLLSGNAQVAGVVTTATNDNAALATGETLYHGGTTGNTFPTYPHFTLTQAANGGIASNFFSSANATLTNDSSLLAAQQANGTVTVKGGTMTLTGTSSPAIR